MVARFVGGRFNGMDADIEGFVLAYPSLIRGYSADLSEQRSKGLLVHRAELDNQPLIDGYLSPMWDGGKLRYETQEVYDMLSR